MYAIINDSGKQLKVEEGEQLNVDFRDAHKGDELTFDKVLCVSDDDGVQIGKPTLAGASVKAEVVGFARGQKLVVQKLRKRKNSRRKTGHRQLYTTVKIHKIVAP
jgi:large subunit ribosomal protein L21